MPSSVTDGSAARSCLMASRASSCIPSFSQNMALSFRVNMYG